MRGIWGRRCPQEIMSLHCLDLKGLERLLFTTIRHNFVLKLGQNLTKPAPWDIPKTR